MKIYLVRSTCYLEYKDKEPSWVECAYTSREKAETEAKRLQEEQGEYRMLDYYVEETELLDSDLSDEDRALDKLRW